MDKDEALKPALERCCNHDSDCAVHSMPAYPNEPCDCSLAALAQPAPQPVQPLQELLNVQLLEALKEVINATWVIDSHVVDTDRLIVFREGYDFDGLDGTSREEFLAEHSCIVWKEGSGKWSAYCTHEGSLWFDRFNSVAEAKEACMRLLDKVMPDHPAMKARAVIANTPPLPPLPEREPVAWMYQHPNNHLKTCYQTYKPNGECAPLYTTPPQRTWVGLTEVDILAASRHWRHAEDFMAGVYWAAGTLKEFNT